MIQNAENRVREYLCNYSWDSVKDEKGREVFFKDRNPFETENSDFQYICSINEDQLTPVKEYLGEKYYDKIIEKNVILNLTDEGENGKLLGIQVNLKYEKNK
jgi:uncharacterized protein YydD (DUF2326 family)